MYVILFSILINIEFQQRIYIRLFIHTYVYILYIYIQFFYCTSTGFPQVLSILDIRTYIIYKIKIKFKNVDR